MVKAESRWGALAEPQFRLLWIGQAVSTLGDRITPIAMAFAVLALHGSATDVGIVIAAGTIPLAGLLLVGGVWADRLDRRRVMLTSDLVRATTQAVTAGLLVTGHATVWNLAALAALYGAAEAFFRPAATGLLPQVISAARLAQGNALVSLSLNAAMIVGPLIAGALIAASSPGTAIAIDSVSFLVSAAFLARIRPTPIVRGARHAFVHELKQGLREVTSRRWLTSLVLGFTVYQCVVLPGVSVLGPVTAAESYHGAVSWAWMTAGFGTGAVVGSIIALRARPGRPLVLCAILLAVGSLQPLVIAVGLPVAVVAALLAVGGASIAVLFAVWDTTLAQEIEPSALSRVSSFDYFGSTVGMPVGFLVIGPLAQHFGATPVMIVVSVIGVTWALGTAALPDVRGMRRRGSLESGPTPLPFGLESGTIL